jgi:ferric-dicitrate binding protein FerR (iron transport regulator)
MRIIAVFAALLAFAAHAAPGAAVSAVQYPAWLERGGVFVPLTPGVELQSSDKVRTGANARVELKLAEGSRVKLGENAQFAIERIEGGGVLRASLGVLSGAFRFTTDPAAKGERRDVQIQVRNVTAGIRGTDVWGKATEERDIVCLLEGRVTVGSSGQSTVTLESPLDFYQKPRGQNALPVAKIDAKQMAQWSAETEIAKDGGAAREGGRWRVIVGTFPLRDAAQKLNRALRAEGYPAKVVGEESPFAVQVAGLASENDARSLIANLRTVPGVLLPRVAQ